MTSSPKPSADHKHAPNRRQLGHLAIFDILRCIISFRLTYLAILGCSYHGTKWLAIEFNLIKFRTSMLRNAKTASMFLCICA